MAELGRRRQPSATPRALAAVLAMALAVVASTLVGGAPAAALPTNCAGGRTSLHTTHSSCLEYQGAGSRGATMVGTAIYGFLPSEGFEPSHVKKCLLYMDLTSSYGTVHTVRFDCTAQARQGGLGYEQTHFWGAGRASGDYYWQRVWMVITTGVRTYSSGPEAARVGLRRP